MGGRLTIPQVKLKENPKLSAPCHRRLIYGHFTFISVLMQSFFLSQSLNGPLVLNRRRSLSSVSFSRLSTMRNLNTLSSSMFSHALPGMRHVYSVPLCFLIPLYSHSFSFTHIFFYGTLQTPFFSHSIFLLHMPCRCLPLLANLCICTEYVYSDIFNSRRCYCRL